MSAIAHKDNASEILLISDLHLSPERPEIIKLFVRFVDEKALHCKALYILGDFFEYWIGDDDPATGLSEVFRAFEILKEQNIPVYFMHGNRDFLAADGFAQRTGVTIINEPCISDFFGEPVALMHGDSLCTDDVKYQQFKQLVRSVEWQKEFLGKSLAERTEIVEALRQTSKDETQEKTENIMDVNDDAVASCFRENKTATLIHGHTHRPGIHTLMVDGETVTRIVLGDWYTSGSYVVVKKRPTSNEPDFALLSYP